MEKAYASWKSDRQSNAIFWDFIEEERNQVLKQYEIGFFAGPVDIVADGQAYTIGEHLFCPITDGPFAGEDCRDILEHHCKSRESGRSELAAIEADTHG